ncbi:MAG: hypothetical protein OZ921_04190 [Sorangiineae bacterium]|nr:hypothetical protein [Sorangiineae bacterium]
MSTCTLSSSPRGCALGRPGGFCRSGAEPRGALEESGLAPLVTLAALATGAPCDALSLFRHAEIAPHRQRKPAPTLTARAPAELFIARILA